MKKLYLAVFLLSFIGACSTTAPRQEIGTFQCGAENIKVLLLGKDDAILTYRGEEHALHRQNTINPVYENIGGSISFWKENNQNYFRSRQNIFPACDVIEITEVNNH